jgi:hypothetical protein
MQFLEHGHIQFKGKTKPSKKYYYRHMFDLAIPSHLNYEYNKTVYSLLRE